MTSVGSGSCYSMHVRMVCGDLLVFTCFQKLCYVHLLEVARKNDVVKEMLSRLRRCQQRDLLSLWEEAKVASNRSDIRRTSDSPNSFFNARRSLQLARKGRFGDALKTLESMECTS